jgi:hypothetical protein
VKALSLCVLVLCVAALAAAAESAQACSCAMPDPRSALASADGAFVGTVVSRRDTADSRAVLTFEVERALKGSLGERVDVVTAGDSAGCGLELPVGTRTALVLDRSDGAWHGGLCGQFSPDDLLAAAKPLPTPNGKGPVALVVGGQFGAVRLMALDASGRTLAYGKGTGSTTLISLCPGGKRLAEIAFDLRDGSYELAIRETASLRRIRTQMLRLPAKRTLEGLHCQNAAGASALLFARRWCCDAPDGSAVYRVSRGGLSAIWHGAAYNAGLTSQTVYICGPASGASGTIRRLDLRTGRLTTIVSLDSACGRFNPDSNGQRLAGVAAGIAGRAYITVVDPKPDPPVVRRVRLRGDPGFGDIFWLSDNRLVFLPSDGLNVARVLDRRLRTLSRFRWSARGAAARGSTVFGLGHNGTLVAANLPSGPMRTIRRLPSPTAYAIAAV